MFLQYTFIFIEYVLSRFFFKLHADGPIFPLLEYNSVDSLVAA